MRGDISLLQLVAELTDTCTAGTKSSLSMLHSARQVDDLICRKSDEKEGEKQERRSVLAVRTPIRALFSLTACPDAGGSDGMGGRV